MDLKETFAHFLLEAGALKFGEFTLKSGRKSPYFFNLGVFNDGPKLARLGEFYAEAILRDGIEADMLFGPAYKGIPIVCATAMALAQRGRVLPFAFNRKERKGHGEGGLIVGGDLVGRKVLVVDDVLTAGTSARESLALIKQAGGTPIGLLVAIDREEYVVEGQKASAMLSREGIVVYSIIKISELIPYLKGDQSNIIEVFWGHCDSDHGGPGKDAL